MLPIYATFSRLAPSFIATSFTSAIGVMVCLVACLLTTTSASAAQRAKRIKPTKIEQRESKNYATNQLFAAYLERGAYRHKVLSENMANVNTPGYKADEVVEANDFEDLIGDKANISGGVGLSKTNSLHLEGKRKVSDRRVREKLKNPYEKKPNGNNVSIAQQMTKLSQNQQDYNAAVKSYATTNALVSAVLGKN